MGLVNVIRKLEKILLLIGVGMLLLMMFLGAADVIGRYLLNKPIKGALEGGQLLMAGVALLSWGYTQAVKGHISVEILFVRYPAIVQSIITLISLLLTTIIFSLIAWQSALIAMESLEQQRMLENIPLPLFPFQLMVPIGASIFCLESIIQLVQILPEMKGNRA